MSKIVQAVNAMIANPENITNVIQGGHSELFFKYRDKYKWSIAKRDEGHYLWFYPGKETLAQLASYEGDDWEEGGISMVAYKDFEIGTREAKASFSDLYTLIKEKLYGVNEALDDIISDADIPF